MMKTESLEHIHQELLPLTMLLGHIKTVAADSTVHEYEVVHGEEKTRKVALIRYMGLMVIGDDSDKAAVMKLLTKIDESLIYGDERNSGDREFDGLNTLANKGEIESLPQVEFFERYDKEKHKHGLRLVNGGLPEAVHEGDLPTIHHRMYAVGHDALRWAQLLPMTKVPLVGMREGKFVLPLDAASPPPEFEREDSREVARSCLLLYGAMYVHNRDAIFALSDG